MPDVMTAPGETKQEKDVYYLGVRLNPAQHARLGKLALESERSVSDVIKWLIEHAEVVPVAPFRLMA